MNIFIHHQITFNPRSIFHSFMSVVLFVCGESTCFYDIYHRRCTPSLFISSSSRSVSQMGEEMFIFASGSAASCAGLRVQHQWSGIVYYYVIICICIIIMF
ncbi:unnamed protein product [Clavelina lepadiformis]|uniref:Uncharacterized protein n=1 Tax=Clavelina lepadiformis TaxID=159417 RepID=A0ABP0EY02_CLALP